jgi:hypothetical protein
LWSLPSSRRQSSPAITPPGHREAHHALRRLAARFRDRRSGSSRRHRIHAPDHDGPGPDQPDRASRESRDRTGVVATRSRCNPRLPHRQWVCGQDRVSAQHEHVIRSSELPTARRAVSTPIPAQPSGATDGSDVPALPGG